ncbi:MAG TPA: arylesterase [Gemmatimonadaceae bacterium]|nr:arylesterase [Gemmatimonadaceae bacterium]
MSMKNLIVGFMAALAACSSPPQVERVPSEAEDQRVADARNGTAAQTDAYGSAGHPDSSKAKVTVLFFGTSLTAGYGLADTKQAFPNLVSQRAAASGTPILAINAGLSGETSAGAVRRIEWVLKRAVDIVVLETGGNDALRALDPDTLKANLHAIVAKIRSEKPRAKIMIVAMQAPPNLGAAYTRQFAQAYRQVAAREGLILVPFLLDNVAGHPELNQGDGIHPNEKGEPIVADNIWKALQPVVREVYGGGPKG